ncbi:MAG: SAM-dependent methyltransferase, partial [Pseudobutyrivibrio sp.]|nr:SAM-dependent methyltransferase [Pseudobutyrivibrio sp.]
MKADYKNWMPKGMVMGTGCGMIASLVLFLILGVSPIVAEGSTKRVIGIVFLILTVIFCVVT